MLTLRFARSGRANSAFFRIVLTEKSKPCDSGFIKILGWYNPHTKEVSLEKETILAWIDKGAAVSNSLAKLLIAQGIKHKKIKFVPDAPKAKKEKKEAGEKPKMQPKIDDQPKADEPRAQKTEEAEAEETPDKKSKEAKKERPIEEPKPDKSENILEPKGSEEKK